MWRRWGCSRGTDPRQGSGIRDQGSGIGDHALDKTGTPARLLHQRVTLSDSRLADLFDEYGPRLYRYALVILRDSEAAEDAVQDTFCGLAKRLARNRDAATAPYAIRALRNRCFSMLRGRRRASAEVPGLLEPCAPDASEEERLILDEALLRLPVEQREVVYLKVFDGMTLQEIAVLSGASINTIGSRYRYAMSALRKALGESESTT